MPGAVVVIASVGGVVSVPAPLSLALIDAAHSRDEVKVPDVSLPACSTKVSAASAKVSSSTGTTIWPVVWPAATVIEPEGKAAEAPMPKSWASAGSPVVPATTRQSTTKPPAGAAALSVTV